MSTAQEMWHFYLYAVGLGIGIPALMFLCVPALINDWFDQRVGTFIGLCFAFTGIDLPLSRLVLMVGVLAIRFLP